MELFDILTFDSIKVENIPVDTTHPDWTDVATLTTPDREAGKYALAATFAFTIDSTTQSFIYQFSLDGGVTWGIEFEEEVKDRTNINIEDVFYVIDHTGGPIDLRMRATRESTATSEVLECILSVERKG